MNVVGFIFARGGSKGLPRKNVRPLGGKPLIAHAIHAAFASRFIERVIVSTEDEEIAAVARQHGAEVPFLRPAELAADHSPEWMSWQHAIRSVNAGSATPLDVFVSVPATAPLRAPGDIDLAIERFLESGADITITVTDPQSNPYFTMVTLDEQQRARLAIQGEKRIARRQDAPAMFDITPVAYVARPEFVLNSNGTFDGRVSAVHIPRERAVDIDTELDFQFAEFLYQRRHAARHAA